MSVVLVAATNLYHMDVESGTPYDLHEDCMTLSADELAELAGRVRFRTFLRTESNADFLQGVLANEQLSLLEHASATFYIDGVSQTTAMALMRHRDIAITQENVHASAEHGFIAFPEPLTAADLRADVVKHWHASCDRFESAVHVLRDHGLSASEAKRAAVAYAPMCTDTALVASGTLKAWRHLVSVRMHPSNDQEVSHVATAILARLKRYAPNTFQDMAVPVLVAEDAPIAA